jgi:hypothetical protein
MAREIAIEELVLRVPGVDEADVPALVDDILRRAQDRLSGTMRTGHVQLAELKVSVPAGGGRDALVAAIADALVEAMR